MTDRERDYLKPAVGQSTHRLQEETNVKTESRDISAGATMAYDLHHFGHQSILLLSAGGNDPRAFYEYVPAEDTWYRRDDVDYDPVDGTSLTTFDAAEEQWSQCPMLAFGDATHWDYPFAYNRPPTDEWEQWIDTTAYFSRFPVDL